MSRTLDVRRSLAATAALVVGVLGATALPAVAEPGNGNGNGNGNGKAQSHKGEQAKSNKGKSNQAKGQKDKGNKGPQGPKNPGKGSANSSNGQGNQGGGIEIGQGNAEGGSGDPAGNNGTVKIAPYGDVDGIPNNTPHPGCEFQIEWYGFDEGTDIVSTVTFAMQAPTDDVALSGTSPSTVFVGGDPATGAGTDTGFDGVQVYTLAFDGEPHAQQGYHVKLTINTPDSLGADVKHKVFWVEPCESETTSEASSGQADSSSETEVLGEQATADDDTEVLGEQATADDDTEVLGEQATADDGDDTEVLGAQASVPNAVDAGEEGNPVLDLVRSPLPLLVIGLGVILAGAAFASRRRSTNV